MKQKMISFMKEIEKDIRSLSNYLYTNFETSYHETNSSKYIQNLMEKYEFNVSCNYLGIENSFIASKGSGHPKICYLCEYDAIENLGHITGHNILTSISVSASLILGNIIDEIGGSVILIGCPGEYLGGTKYILLKQGAFDDIDAVMECHPSYDTAQSGTSYAIIPLSIKYFGHSSLAFLNQDKYSALDALLLTINSIESLTKTFPNNSYINYVISNGGQSPIIIPEKTELKLYIRSQSYLIAEKIQKQIEDLCNNISNLTKIDNKISMYETPNKELKTNVTLNRLFNHNLKECGIIHINPPKNVNAGLSIGAISNYVPTIHPYISIIDNTMIKYGTRDFADYTQSSFAFSQLQKSALALAYTGSDLILKPSLLNEVKNYFYSN